MTEAIFVQQFLTAFQLSAGFRLSGIHQEACHLLSRHMPAWKTKYQEDDKYGNQANPAQMERNNDRPGTVQQSNAL